MTQSVPSNTMSLSDVVAMIQITPGDAIGLLNSIAEANADKSPTLIEALNKTIAELSNPPAPKASDTTPTY